MRVYEHSTPRGGYVAGMPFRMQILDVILATLFASIVRYVSSGEFSKVV